MWLMTFPEMLDVHIKPHILERLGKDRRVLVDNLLLGVNIQCLDQINGVAEAMLKIPKKRIRTISRLEFIAEFLCGHDFIDESGQLV